MNVSAACYRCGLPGRVFRRLCRRGRVFLRYRCHNNACMFDYVNYDGHPARGRATWTVYEGTC